MADHVTVSVAQGALRGKKTTTKSGGPLVSFQGLPYAKPPVGPLRFKPPEPAVSWSGTRDALEEGPICTQNDPITDTIRGQEDCLYLNVYTTQLPASSRDSLKPVMVWIHGGGFHIGSGNNDIYGPDFLVDAGVVLVTFNYRLGPLGFLSLSNEAVPGNMGLKDQVLALRWVQQNIAVFGGDPSNVTIFGESAGGASVHYHLLSPMSKGLFHKAIAQSGSALNPWAFTRSSRTRAFRLGEELDCKTDDPQELLNCLMAAEPNALFEAANRTITKVEKSKGIALPFVPTVEPEVLNQEGFLTREPITVIREGKFHKVPFIAGITSHEGMIVLKDLLVKPSIISKIDDDFQRMVPEDLRDKKNVQHTQEISSKMKKFYFDNKPFSKDTLLEYVHMNTDLLFMVGIEKMVKQQSALSSAPVYYYQFLFDGKLGFVKMFVGCDDMPGACHGVEIGYLFRPMIFDVDLDPKSPEAHTLTRMVKLWTNFAKTGDPTPTVDSDLPVQWTPYTVSNTCYLKIDNQLSMGVDLEKKRMDFWEALYCSKL